MRLAYLIFVCGLLPFAATAWAGSQERDNSNDSYWSRFTFHFDRKSININNGKLTILNPQFKSLNSGLAKQYEQLDARLLYPLGGKQYQFDIGLNLRYIQQSNSANTFGGSRFGGNNRTIPAFYADALVELPYKGFAAGLEGSHDPLGNQFLDYRAKLRYQWSEQLGLQGGWQHQQMSHDLSENSGSRVTNDGPFLDFYFRF